MASSSNTGEPSTILDTGSEQDPKTPAARRNTSRSEEGDSDDSGVIRDVARRLTVEAKSPEVEAKKEMEIAEADVSLGSPKPQELAPKAEIKEEIKEEEELSDWRRRRRKKQDVGRYPMGPTTMSLKVTMNCVCNLNKTVEQTLKEF